MVVSVLDILSQYWNNYTW